MGALKPPQILGSAAALFCSSLALKNPLPVPVKLPWDMAPEGKSSCLSVHAGDPQEADCSRWFSHPVLLRAETKVASIECTTLSLAGRSGGASMQLM